MMGSPVHQPPLIPSASSDVERIDDHALDAPTAESLGYRPLTNGYGPSERGMLARVIADMQAGGIDFCLVPICRGFFEVWRKNLRNAEDNRRMSTEAANLV